MTAILQAQYRHRFLPADNRKLTVANGSFGKRRLHHGLGGFGVFRQVVKVDIGLIAVVVVDVCHHGLTEHIGVNRRAISFHRNTSHAIGINQQARTAHILGTVERATLRGQRRAAL